MEAELQKFKNEIILAISDSHEAIKLTGDKIVVDAIDQAVPKAIRATFIQLGVDCDKPFEAQQDFAFLRQGRKNSENRKKVVVQTFIKSFTTFCISAITAGFLFWCTHKGKN